MLRIYGTAFNNADLADKSIASIKGLMPYRFYIIDNYSSDGTYEKLCRYKDISIKQVRCKRGKGRDIALRMLLEEADDNDPVMYIDLDEIFGKRFVSTILQQIRQLRHGEMRMLFQGLSTAKTNRKLPWRDLNIAEDWERLARAKASGVRIVEPREMWRKWRTGGKDWITNRGDTGFMYSDREKRYSGSMITHRIRMFKLKVDYERGVADKSFAGFYEKAARKGLLGYMTFRLAYHLARMLGVYSYDKRLNNRDYPMGFVTDVKRKL
jgi:glycosyltransferase involved in cell wall biosynthesis